MSDETNDTNNNIKRHLTRRNKTRKWGRLRKKPAADIPDKPTKKPTDQVYIVSNPSHPYYKIGRTN